jgi:hypothetical protein
MSISLKANSDGSSEILNGVATAIKINADNSLENPTIDGKLDKSENIVLGASVIASGVAVDFTGIPAGVKRITVMFDGVSTSGTSDMILRIGSGSIEKTGYAGYVARIGGTNAFQIMTTGFDLQESCAATYLHEGKSVLERLTTLDWSCVNFMTANNQNATVNLGVGSKTLTGTLDRIRITTVNGTDTFDAGTINISWEF